MPPSTQLVIDTDALTWMGDDDAATDTLNGVHLRAIENAGVAEFYLAGDLLPNAGDSSTTVTVRGSRPCRVTIGGNVLAPTEFDGSAEGQQPGPGGGRGGDGGIGGTGGDGGRRIEIIQPAGGQGVPGSNGGSGFAGSVKVGENGLAGNAGTPPESGADGFGMPGSGGVARTPSAGNGGDGGDAGTAGGGGAGGLWVLVAGTPGGNGGDGLNAGDATGGDHGEDQIGAPGLRTASVEFAGGGGGAGAAGGAGGGGGAGGTAASGSGGAGGGSGITGRGGNGGGAVGANGGAGGKGGDGASHADGGGGGGALWVSVRGRSTEVTINAAGGNGTNAGGTDGTPGQGGDPARGPNGPASSPTETGGAGGSSGSVGRGGNGAPGGRGGNATGGGGAGGSAILEFGAGDGPLFRSNVQPGVPGGAVGESTSRRVLQSNPFFKPASSDPISTPYISDLQGGAEAFGIMDGHTYADLPILTVDAPPGAFVALYRTNTLFGFAEPGYEWLVYANLSSESIEDPGLQAGADSNLVSIPLARGGDLRTEFGGPGVQDINALPSGALFVTLIPENPGAPVPAVFEGSQAGITRTRATNLQDGEVVFLAPPVEIDSLAELDDIRNNLSWDYILTADIDASPTSDPGYNGGLGWEPIGADPMSPFRGVLDGDGFAIDDLVIDRQEMMVGLFGNLEGPGEIRDLTIRNATVTGGNFVGILAGAANAGSIISGCVVEGGSVDSTLTVDCVSGGNLGSCLMGLGGLAGGVFDANVDNCHSSASVLATGFTGGESGTVPVWTGGLVGVLQISIIESSSASGNVTVEVGTAYAGGLVGGLYGVILDSYSTGDVISTKVAGGLAGAGDAGGNAGANASYATGNVTGGESAGGIIGKGASAGFCYSLGTLTSPGTAAGICAGDTDITAYSFSASVFALGATTAIPLAADVKDSYWDFTVSGLAASDTEGRTTAEMTFPYDYTTCYVSPEWQPGQGYWVYDAAGSPSAPTGPNNGYPYHTWQTARVTATYAAGTGGQLRVDGGAYVPGATLTRIPGASSGAIEAVPASGSVFLRWSDGSTQNPRLDRNLQEDLGLTAIFDVSDPSIIEVIDRLLGRTTTGLPDRNGDGVVDAADLR
ncbi:hypothetical protein KQI84_02375 [bacterium]|nr:hypothetical protein [bacterium]